MSAAEVREERLAKARLLVACLEAGREDDADLLAREVAGAEALGVELGRLTRELHSALDSLRVDPRISELASNDIPDAREKLGWVLALTEQAAHAVIGAVEEGLPIAARVARAGGAVEASADGERLHQLLNDILMAQSFQDLTGQAIRRVIEVSAELERQLAALLQRTGLRAQNGTKNGASAGAPAPSDGERRLQGQDEVDALLSGLGF